MKELYGALIKAQVELKNTPKDKFVQVSDNGRGYYYSDLATLIEFVKPILQKFELGFTQLVTNDNDKICVITILFHVSGEKIENTLCLPLATVGKTNNVVQLAGATITYARRYSLSSILGIASDEDTDASDVETSKPKGDLNAFKKALDKITTSKELDKLIRMADARTWTKKEEEEIQDIIDEKSKKIGE